MGVLTVGRTKPNHPFTADDLDVLCQFADQAALAANQKERKKCESEIQIQEQKISKWKDQMLQAKTNEQYRAFQHEIEFCEKEVRRLEDRFAINDLVVAYATLLDDAQWDQLGELFTDDGVFASPNSIRLFSL